MGQCEGPVFQIIGKLHGVIDPITQKKNTYPKYPDFDTRFPKLPCYLRRSAISSAFGKCRSYKSNLATEILRQYLINGGAGDIMLKLGIGIQLTTKKLCCYPKKLS